MFRRWGVAAVVVLASIGTAATVSAAGQKTAVDFKQVDPKAVLEQLNEAIRAFPDSAKPHLARGRFHQAHWRLDKALKDFNKALSLDPNNADATLARGEVRHLQGDIEEALADYTAAIRINPKLTDPYRRRAQLHRANGAMKDALADVNEVLHRDPADNEGYGVRASILQAQGVLDKALADYAALIRHDARKYVFAWIARGLIWLEKGDPDKALEDLNEALRLAPKYRPLYQHRSRVWIAKRDLQNALDDLGNTFLTITIGADGKGDDGGAEECHDELVRAFPASAAAHLARGRVRKHKQFTRNAPPPDLAFAYGLLNRAENRKGDADEVLAVPQRPAVRPVAAGTPTPVPDRVLEDFNEAIRLDPGCAAAYLERARIWSSASEPDRAIADYSAAIDKGAREIDAFTGRGKAWQQKREFDRAIGDLNAAIRLRQEQYQEWLRDRRAAGKREAVNTWVNDEGAHGVVLSVEELWALPGRSVWSRAALSELPEMEDIEGPSLQLHQSAELFCDRAKIWEQKREIDKALTDYAEVIRLVPGSFRATNGCAWIWATAADAKHRDGKKALKWALKARDQWNVIEPEWVVVNTLAAAYAETGDFAQAVERQTKALKMMEATKAEAAEVASAKERLALYGNGEPYRDGRK